MKTFIPVNATLTHDDIVIEIAANIFNLVASTEVELDILRFFDEDGNIDFNTVDFIRDNLTDEMCQYYVDADYAFMVEGYSHEALKEMHIQQTLMSEQFQPLREEISKYIRENQPE